MDGSEPGKPMEYYVLRRGEMFGPLFEEDLRAGVADGRFALDDFVQVEGRVVWEPVGRILDAFADKQRGAVAPDWKCILKWAWVRLRYSLGEQSVYAASVCAGMGALALTLSRWPFVFWAPWFALAAAAALTFSGPFIAAAAAASATGRSGAETFSAAELEGSPAGALLSAAALEPTK